MKNIKSFLLSYEGSSGIVCESKEEFLQYISEEIDRIDKEGNFEHFDVLITPNNA